MKRNNEFEDKINSKKIKSNYVNATELKNYVSNDLIVDYLKYSGKYFKNNNISYFLMNQGKKFEENVINYIKKKHPVIFVSEFITEKSVSKTIELMNNGTPIIHSAPIINNNNKTKGIIDILIRSDYLHLLTNTDFLTKDEIEISSPKLKHKKFHYLVVDIKFSTTNLCSNGKYILNSGLYSVYKSQILIYTQAIGNIQGYISNYGFILGRKCVYSNKNDSYVNNNLGIIDYNTYDNKFIELNKNAIKWINNLKLNCDNFKIGISPELYPNMKVDSYGWNEEKKKISSDIGEITTIWNCGVKNRNNCFKKGITSWKDHKCNSVSLGINGNRGKVVNAILNINRQKKKSMRPNKLKKCSMDTIIKNDVEFYVDFETFTDIFNTDNSNIDYVKDIIFMIGVSYIKNEILIYKKFICSIISYVEENRIITEFIDFIKKEENPTLYYWSAEEKFWKKSLQRYNINIQFNWIDILNIFIKECIVIKNCFDYKLKNISKAMLEHGLINTELESKCIDGMTAMINAYNVYSNNEDIDSSVIMNDIIKYNKYDCNVLYDIMKCLRNKYL